MKIGIVGHLFGILNLKLTQICLAISKDGSNNRIGRLGALGIHLHLVQGDTACISRLNLDLGHFLRAVDNHVENSGCIRHDSVSGSLVGILHCCLNCSGITERDTQFLALYIVSGCGVKLNTSPAFCYGNLVQIAIVGHLIGILYLKLRQVGLAICIEDRSRLKYGCLLDIILQCTDEGGICGIIIII